MVLCSPAPLLSRTVTYPRLGAARVPEGSSSVPHRKSISKFTLFHAGIPPESSWPGRAARAWKGPRNGLGIRPRIVAGLAGSLPITACTRTTESQIGSIESFCESSSIVACYSTEDDTAVSTHGQSRPFRRLRYGELL